MNYKHAICMSIYDAKIATSSKLFRFATVNIILWVIVKQYPTVECQQHSL